MRYVPKKRRLRVKWHLILPIFLVFALIIYGAYYLIESREKPNALKLCQYNAKETAKFLAEKEYEGTIALKDFHYYGESLALFQNEYEFAEKDPLLGKMVVIKEICSEEEYTFVLGPEVDKYIDVAQLQEGFYEVYIMEGVQKLRVYFDEKVTDDFYTITRNGENNLVHLVADKDLARSKEKYPAMDKNYLFIQVSKSELPEDVYDIAIDAGHATYDYGKDYPEHGASANGLVESEENYKAAVVVKEKLEALGYKVLMIREGFDHYINTYGVDGRLHKMYQHQPKLYLQFHLNSAESTAARGMEIYYSSYASNEFAKEVLNQVTSTTNLKASGSISNGAKVPSLIPCGQVRDTKDNKLYDNLMIIRETGGQLLGVARFGDLSPSANGSFTKDVNKGTNTILVEYLYISNINDVELWKNHYQEYASATADGINNYINR